MLKFILWKRYYPEALSEDIKFVNLNSRETFDYIYWEMLKKGSWKSRKSEEKLDIFRNYTIVKINNIIVGWYSLIDCEIGEMKWKMLECIFSKKTWVGDCILKKVTKKDTVFAYSSNEEFFSKNGFLKVEWKRSETLSDLYLFQR